MDKPFSKFDLSNEETLRALLYGMVSENNENVFNLHSFNNILEQEKTRSDIMRKFWKEIEYMNQFKSEGGGENDVYMGELAATLILAGMDAHFVLYEMKLFEISDYIKALDDKKKEQMESDRLWTFLNVLPHVGKKLKSPQKLMPFPWDGQKTKEEKEAEFDKGIEMFEKFFNSKPENHE